MKSLIAMMLGLVGVIHLLPLAGLLGAERLSALYGVAFTDPNLVILMRHRAVLFGLFGGYLLYAAFLPAHQRLALIAAWVSVVSFLYLALTVGGYSVAIARVVWADVMAALCLGIATLAMFVAARPPN